MQIEMVPIQDIVPYEQNPRKNDRAVEVVAKSIKEFGFLVPVILDDKNVIVAGHTRIKAALKLGLAEIPVVYTENLNEKQIKVFRIMDNKTHEFANWDFELLKIELNELDNLKFDLNLTGFSVADIENMDKFMDKDSKNIDENISTENKCPRCSYKW